MHHVQTSLPVVCAFIGNRPGLAPRGNYRQWRRVGRLHTPAPLAATVATSTGTPAGHWAEIAASITRLRAPLVDVALAAVALLLPDRQSRSVPTSDT